SKGKMSKSQGEVIDPVSLKDKFGMDVFRYFVFREMVFGLDGAFNHEAFEARYNADLANNLGNLVSRSIAMVIKYREGVVPSATQSGELEDNLSSNLNSLLTDVEAFISNVEIHKAIE